LDVDTAAIPAETHFARPYHLSAGGHDRRRGP
jgi:hypothetical protein